MVSRNGRLDTLPPQHSLWLVLARLPRLLVALALAVSIGLHWTVLQVVAWTGMVISYSQDAPLAEAVVKTLDGNHPCTLCKQIAKGKQSEKKSEFKFEVKKLEFPFVRVAFSFSAPTSFWELRAGDERAELLTHSPPLPPPRNLLS